MVAPKGHEAYNKNGEGGAPKIYTKEFIEAEALALEEWIKRPESIYFKRFAFERGYSYKRLYEFAEVNQRFSDIMLLAKEWQEFRLAEGGLTNEFNSGFTKFVMGNVCGWADKTETKVSGDAANPFTVFISNFSDSTKDLVDDIQERN
jgi:hypothetical protein